MNNNSLRTADPTTHLKVVCFSLIGSIIIVVAALVAPATMTSAAWGMP